MMQRLSVCYQIPSKICRQSCAARKLTNENLLPCQVTQSHSQFRATHILSASVLGLGGSSVFDTNGSTSGSFNIQPRRYKGHSKWSNIRHIKAAKDSSKQAATTHILLQLRGAVRGEFHIRLFIFFTFKLVRRKRVSYFKKANNK